MGGGGMEGKVWQSTHKAVHTQGGLWPPQESCYLRGVWGLAPASSEVSRLSSAASRRVRGTSCRLSRVSATLHESHGVKIWLTNCGHCTAIQIQVQWNLFLRNGPPHQWPWGLSLVLRNPFPPPPLSGAHH